MKGEENVRQWKFSLSMGMAILWHGTRDDVGVVGIGLDLHDPLLGIGHRRFDFFNSVSSMLRFEW